ncbi:periplasmic binding protein/LacI transcriptional regulator [Fictibacillus macauensis ZFHKF-1]|uniref:Periplasmic binding protein/LacI transcriptional regulator n=1 Tax=Fictibacillus macauensis ZFHKF-1 TaxID=1196324 RepID=I8UDG0_9BACL|nr:LacI family DNA-binding transcriptional regulator [Fictibacillus macauensis]EIT84848.1 periplasmic binding protein/LacI transcriptional regulator [Fictibacillus macauensis ZFHKF-1]
MEGKATIQDVARQAGVSIATVSRVINGQGGVRPKTEARIVQAIEELAYIRNAAARTMKSKATKTIGVVVPDISNPFFPLVMSGIEEKAREQGYIAFLSGTKESTVVEQNVLKSLIERGVDGVILTTADENGQHLTQFIEQDIPLVAVDRSLPHLEVDHVLVDNRKGAYQAIQRLILQGHERIAIICGPLSTTPGRDRLIGYKEALHDFHLSFNEAYVIEGDFSEQSGYDAVGQLYVLEEPPTAIFTCNNLMTTGCLKALDNLQWKLGRDVSVIGFDDIDLATFVQPKLTVVSRPMKALGELAFQLLHERIEMKQAIGKRSYQLSPELIIRESCMLK